MNGLWPRPLLLEGVPASPRLSPSDARLAIHTYFHRIIHPRPPARRPRRHAGLHPKTATSAPARAHLRQHHPRRRNQPRAGQGAVGPARGHAGTQVTIGQETFLLPDPFSSSPRRTPSSRRAPIPSRSAGRSLQCSTRRDIPPSKKRRRILDANAPPRSSATSPRRRADAIRRARLIVDEIYVDDKIKDYILSIVFATRDPPPTSSTRSRQRPLRASPRATSTSPSPPAPTPSSRAAATSPRRTSNPSPRRPPAPRHPSFEAEAEDMTADKIVATLLNELPVP
jgi:hypothetical protein